MPSVRAVEGGEIRVTCPVSGYPIQSITWQKGGEKKYKKVSFPVYIVAKMASWKRARIRLEAEAEAAVPNCPGH